MSLREADPAKTPLRPNTVIGRTTGAVIDLDDPVLWAVTVVIAEDYMAPLGPSGTSDVISAAHDALTMLKVLDAAGLRAVPKD